MANKVAKEAKHAIEWLAAEFKFLQKLHDDLNKIEDEPIEEQEKELKKDVQVVRYIGRAERRVEGDVKDIIEQLESAKAEKISSDEFDQLLQELEVPAHQLVRDGSLYVGKLREQLQTLRTDTAIAEKYPDKVHKTQVQSEIKKLESEVEKLEEWVAALDVALKKTYTIFEKQMPFSYSPLKRKAKELYRKIHPIPGSPYTIGKIDNICAVNLVPPAKLIKFFKRCLRILAKLKRENIGDYLEFGVFNGSSISSMYFAREELGLSQVRLFGFDGFQGLPASADKEDAGVFKSGFYTCSYPQMIECLKKRKIDPKNMTFVKGWYEDTLNERTKRKLGINNIGIAFIDCDTYKSSRTVLDFLGPLLTKPAILCFDDWKLYDLDLKKEGEYRSFNEFLLENKHLKAKPIKSYNRKSRTFLVQPL